MELIRGGTDQMLADVPTFAFESQVSYPASWDLLPGDTLRATCVWDTTPRTGTTGFGEGTTDEMCYLFIAHYPPFGEYSCGD
jgi:dopamine beta-monooxygenase